jgi:tetratricopeptide (TPR) repeat protein
MLADPRSGGAQAARLSRRLSPHWRGSLRFVLAAMTLSALYLGVERAWLWGAGRLMYAGWTYENPERAYAMQAAQLAVRSRAPEASLTSEHSAAALALGFEYGYLCDWFGSWASFKTEAERMLWQAAALRSLDLKSAAQQMVRNAQFLGVGELSPLASSSMPDVEHLAQRLEDDEGGIAARVERMTSPRLRELFLLGAQVGLAAARLEPRHESPWPAPAELIGKHGTLAGVPAAIWRPLTRVSEGDRTEALAKYHAAVDALRLYVKPDDANFFYNRGIAYGRKGDLDHAIQDFDQAIHFKPDFADAFFNRGTAYIEKNDLDRAIRDLDQAIRLRPDDASALNNRCFARVVAERELEVALSDCNESLRLRPRDTNTLESRGLLLFKMHRYDKAIEDFSASLGLNPKSAGSLYMRGLSNLRTGELRRGNADVRAAREIDVKISETYAGYGVKPE